MKNSSNTDCDPFKSRPGHTLSFSEVSLAAKIGKQKRDILKEVSGSVTPKQICGIVGPNGAGKSSLLKILAGRLSNCAKYSVKKNISIDGVEMDPVKVQHKFGYVEQYDLSMLVHTATPREAIYLSARLKLPKSVDDNEVRELTTCILEELSLTSVADTVIGKSSKEGTTGLNIGERRRVSLGIALVARPSLLFLDEVTQGLDKEASLQVMKVIQKVARSGAAVVMAVEEPSSEMFQMMDHVMFLSSGQVTYQGSPQSVGERFGPVGNTVDLDNQIPEAVAEKDVEEAGISTFEQETSSAEAISKADSDDKDQSSSTDSLSFGKRISTLKQARLLLQREYRHITRDPSQLLIRLGTFLLGSIFVSIFLMDAGEGDLSDTSDLASIMSALFFSSFLLIIAMQFVLVDWEYGHRLFVKEYKDGCFNMISFFLAKLPFEIIFGFVYTIISVVMVYFALGFSGSLWVYIGASYLFVETSMALGLLFGSMFKEPTLAKQLVLPVVALPQALLSGFFTIPTWPEWLQWLNPYMYLFRLLIAEELEGCLDFTAEEEHAYMCLNSYFNPTLGANYDLSTKLSLWSTGNYTGFISIEEYFNLFSPLADVPNAAVVNYCITEDSKDHVVYHPTDDGSCDISHFRAYRGQYHPYALKDDEIDNSWIIYSGGARTKFDNRDENGTLMDDILLHNVDIYFPPAASETFTTVADKDKMIDDICSTMEQYCPSTLAANGFASKSECEEAFSIIPTGTTNEEGFVTYDGNSTTCRYLHAALARQRPQFHCEHISFFPMADIVGNVKCTGVGMNDSPRDYFDDKDYQVLSDTAFDADLNGIDHFALVSEDEAPACVSTSDAPVDVLSAFGDIPELPDTLECRAFLTEQGATGAENIQYWMTMLGMYVIFRLGALALLHLRTKTKRSLFK